MPADHHYDADFYAAQADESLTAARVVLARLFEHMRPAAMLDVGAGVGTWVKAALELGVPDALGLDGDWVRPEQLVVPAKNFKAVDLKSPSLAIDATYDLAISMEVLEHLPADAADRVARLIARAAPVVLFSAAIPGQGGTDHINLRWQSHWARIFAAEGHLASDAMRRRVWADPDVPFWYKQNMVLYARPDAMARLGFEATHIDALDIVHPALYTNYHAWFEKRQARRFSVKWKRLRKQVLGRG